MTTLPHLTVEDQQCCGSEMFNPDPNFFHPGSRIRIQEFKYSIFNPKMVSMLSEIWFGLFIPDPDPDFLPISDPGPGSKTPDPGSATLRPAHFILEAHQRKIMAFRYCYKKKAKPKSPTPLVTFALCRIEWRCRLPFELGLPGRVSQIFMKGATYLYILDLDMQKPEQWALSNKP